MAESSVGVAEPSIGVAESSVDVAELSIGVAKRLNHASPRLVGLFQVSIVVLSH